MKLHRRVQKLEQRKPQGDEELSLEDLLNSDWMRLADHWRKHPDECPDPGYSQALVDQNRAIDELIRTGCPRTELDRIGGEIDAMIRRGLQTLDAQRQDDSSVT